MKVKVVRQRVESCRQVRHVWPVGGKESGERFCINGLKENGQTLGLCGLGSGERVPVTYCWLWKRETVGREVIFVLHMGERERRYKIYQTCLKI